MKLELFVSHEQKNVVEIEGDPLEFDFKSEGFLFKGPFHITCEITGSEDVAHIRCSVFVPVILQCALCLDEFTDIVGREFTLVAQKLRNGMTVPGNSEDNNDEDSLIFIHQDTNTLDITGFVRDAVILSIPLKPVCRENCKGLCSVCGHNLNKGDCGCKRESIDTRWKDLSGLLKTDRKNE